MAHHRFIHTILHVAYIQNISQTPDLRLASTLAHRHNYSSIIYHLCIETRLHVSFSDVVLLLTSYYEHIMVLGTDQQEPCLRVRVDQKPHRGPLVCRIYQQTFVRRKNTSVPL